MTNLKKQAYWQSFDIIIYLSEKLGFISSRSTEITYEDNCDYDESAGHLVADEMTVSK